MKRAKTGSALALAILLTGSLAGADDIPGTVVIDDENGVGDKIAYTAPAGVNDLGQDGNAFSAKMREGEYHAAAVAVDVLTSAVVATVLEIHQPTSTKHWKTKGNLKQLSHVTASFVVFDNLVDLNELGRGTALAPGCKGQGTVSDANADGVQDGARWLFQCVQNAFDGAIADISGNDPATAVAAAQAVAAGKVRISGRATSPPTVATGILEDVLD